MSRAPAAKAVRCAIYTRKSSEEGLDQAFNSLQAQRESCEAYVLSQAGEGWTALPALYDDGGFSGGNLERPALRRLLADIDSGRVDIVVVYKIDRLTRALTDFAKIVDRLDGAGASFVSVTQAFNTTTSMGRLTLNVLLSFAQFEREVTGERIRDKISASKAKGMWMGGNPPHGYDKPTDLATRALVVNEAEAETVRLIFAKYLELRSVNHLERWLHAAGITSKAWVSTRGRQMGGAHFSRGALFHLLKNRIYLGEIGHKDKSVARAHPPIVDQVTFDAAQALMAGQARRHRERPTKAAASVLKGLIFDADARPMSPVFGYGKTGRLYRYYASAPLQQGASAQDDDALRRVPAKAADDLVIEALERIGRRSVSTGEVGQYLRRVELHPTTVQLVLDTVAIIGRRQDSETAFAILRQRLKVGERLVADGGEPSSVRVVMPVRLKVRGGRSWLALPDGSAAAEAPRIDSTLIRGLGTAHALIAEIGARPFGSAAEHQASKGPGNPYRQAMARIAFLAPEIQAAIVGGRQPAGLNLEQLRNADMPLAWADQKALFGFWQAS